MANIYGCGGGAGGAAALGRARKPSTRFFALVFGTRKSRGQIIRNQRFVFGGYLWANRRFYVLYLVYKEIKLQ